MCEFKYCRGTGKCFLSKTSPCSGFVSDELTKQTKSVRGRSVRMSYPGFLNHEELMDILNMADESESIDRMGSLIGAAPKFLRRAQAALQSNKRNVA